MPLVEYPVVAVIDADQEIQNQSQKRDGGYDQHPCELPPRVTVVE